MKAPDGSRIALLLAYDGAAYRGWQVQPDVRTIQGIIGDAIRPLAGQTGLPVAASRTDAGVHALGQVATFATARPLTPSTIRAALNSTLPRDVRILSARLVPDTFDARRSARLKRYGYVIARGAVHSPFLRSYAWHVPRSLDVRAMRAALGALRGTHDFTAFQAAAGRERHPVCTVHGARLVRRGSLLGVVVSADAFLHHMVRNIVGTVVEVGLGRKPAEWVGEVLGLRDRRRAGPTAPAHGLFLLSVRYAFPLFPGAGRHRFEEGLRPSPTGLPAG